MSRFEGGVDQGSLNSQIFHQQQVLVSALKHEIVRLQTQANEHTIERQRLQMELAHSQEEVETLKKKSKFLSENNEALLQTVQVFQRQFIKGASSNTFKRAQPQSSTGPFHLEVIRTLRSKLTNSAIEPFSRLLVRSPVSDLYGFFLQQSSIEESQVELFNEIIEEKKLIRASKIKSFGRKNYFSENFRHLFWFTAIQNKLQITEKLYQMLSSSIKPQKENSMPNIFPNEMKSTGSSIIDLDLRRMDLKLDELRTQRVSNSIKSLLETFEVYRPDIRYVQGMSYIAWILLIRMNAYHAFASFCNIIICDPLINGLYTFHEAKIKRVVSFFNECVADKLPRLSKHMEQIGVESDLFIIEWAYTFYSRAFSLRIVSKIWDLWISEGYNVFFKVALTLCSMFEGELLEKKQNDQFIEAMKNNCFKVEETQFLKSLTKMKLSEELKLENIF